VRRRAAEPGSPIGLAARESTLGRSW